MSSTVTVYRIFIATPSGLEAERRAFRATLLDDNETDALQRGVMFVPVGWEDTLGGMGRPQELINRDLRMCDYFMLIVWDRWGTPPGIEGTSQFTSGTEEEFNTAVTLMADASRPM